MRQTIQDPRRRSHNEVFPAAWGEPPGTRFSSERTAWIAGNIHNAASGASGHIPGATSAEVALQTAERLAEKSNRSAYLALARADVLARNADHAWLRPLRSAVQPTS